MEDSTTISNTRKPYLIGSAVFLTIVALTHYPEYQQNQDPIFFHDRYFSILGFILSVTAGLFAYTLTKRTNKLNKSVEQKSSPLITSRNTEEKFKTNEKYFQSLVENISGAIVLMDRNGKVTYQSPGTERITGYSLPEIQITEDLNLIHADDRAESESSFRLLASSPGAILHQKFRFRHKGGHYIWLEGTFNNLLNDKNIKAIVYSFHDVTKRVESEQRVTLANRLYQVVSQINQAMIHVTDESTLFKEACHIAVDLANFKMAWIGMIDETGLNVVPVVHAGEEYGYLKKLKSLPIGKDLSNGPPIARAILTGTYICCNDIGNDPRMKPWAADALARGYRSSIALPIKKFGRTVGTFNLYSPILNYFNNSDIDILVETTSNISFRLESFEKEKILSLAEMEIKKANERFEMIASATNDAVFEYNILSEESWHNKSFMRLFIKGDDGTNFKLNVDAWRAKLHPDDKDRVLNKLRAAYNGTSTNWSDEFRFQKADGSYGYFYDRAFITRDESGKAIRLLGSMIEITELKEAEQEIEEERKLSANLISSLPGIFYFYDSSGKLIKWNKNFETVSEYSAEEISQMHPLDFFDVDEKKLLKEKIEMVFNSGGAEVRAHFYTKTRKKIPYYFTGCRVNFSGIDYLMGVGIDVSEQRKAEIELRESERKYRLLFHNNPMPMWMLSIPSYNIIDVNDSAIAHYGYSREEFRSMNARDLRPPEELERFEQEILPVERVGVNFSGPWKHRKKNGEILIVEVASHDVKFERENVRIILANDVTQQVHTLTELKESEARLAEAQTVAKVGSWETDLSTMRVVWSKENYRIFEISRDRFQNSHPDFLKYVHPEDVAEVDAAFKNSFKNSFINQIEHRIITPGGNIKFIVECWRVFHDDHGQPVRALGTSQDITERKTAEVTIRQSQVALRQLSAHLQTIREEERTHIAREIHDELGQQLTGLKMDASWLLKKIPTEEKKLHEKLDGMLLLMDDTVKTIRRISSDLRPGILDDLGLIAALEWHSSEFEKRTGVHCTFKSLLDEVYLEKNLATGIFRVYQETLTNVMRHAQATSVETFIERVGNDIILTVKDNGKGFDLTEAKQGNSLGLVGMQERALMLNGELIIEKNKNKGTIITLRVPLVTKPEQV